MGASYQWVSTFWLSVTACGSELTLTQVMAWFLLAPIHHLNQWWLIIGEIMCNSPEGNFTGNAMKFIHARIQLDLTGAIGLNIFGISDMRFNTGQYNIILHVIQNDKWRTLLIKKTGTLHNFESQTLPTMALSVRFGKWFDYVGQLSVFWHY